MAFYKQDLVSAHGFVKKLNDTKEDKSNKVTAISASSTDDEYASAKATYNAINTKVVAQIIRH